MLWTDFKVDKLKQLCHQGYDNKDIATRLDCSLTDVYAKRSQLGITIAKCKGIEANPKFEEAFETVKPRGMTKDVKKAFKALNDVILWAMARDWTSVEDARVYHQLANELITLKAKYNARIGK